MLSKLQAFEQRNDRESHGWWEGGGGHFNWIITHPINPNFREVSS